MKKISNWAILALISLSSCTHEFNYDPTQEVKENAEKCKLKVATYMRQMALNGIVKIYEPYTFSFLISRLSGIGNNINQIAKVANSTDSIYEADILSLKEEFAEMKDQMQPWLDYVTSGEA